MLDALISSKFSLPKYLLRQRCLARLSGSVLAREVKFFRNTRDSVSIGSFSHSGTCSKFLERHIATS